MFTHSCHLELLSQNQKSDYSRVSVEFFCRLLRVAPAMAASIFILNVTGQSAGDLST